MTSRYPQHSGIYQANKALGDDQVTIAHQLAAAGYQTGYAGKWHLSGFQANPKDPDSNWQPKPDGGWGDTRFMWNNGHYKHVEMREELGRPHGERHQMGDERSYASDWLTDRTIDFIDEHQKNSADSPFAYMVSFPDPHQPYKAREPYASMFKPEDIAIPATFAREDVPDWLAREREKKISRCWRKTVATGIAIG